jgi:hypothetical protein
MQSLMGEKESYQIGAKETLKKLVDDKVSWRVITEKVSPHAVAHGGEGILSDCCQGDLEEASQ